MRNDSTINYEVDRTIDHIKHELGTLRRLSVAVVVNYTEKDGQSEPLDPSDMDKINDLVRQAMAYSAERGDSLSVVNTAFSENSQPRLPAWQNPQYQHYALELGKYLLVLIALLFVWRSIVKPIIKGFADAQVERARHEARSQASNEQRRQDELRASEISRYEENLNTARTMAQKDPRAVAMVLRSWMEKNGTP